MSKIIEVENLKKYYGNKKVVDNISFEVEKGEFFSFLGVNGAGKSTTINILTTLYGASDGTAYICGHECGKENIDIRRKIGVVYQENCLDDKLSVTENLIVRGNLYEKNKTKISSRMNELTKMLDLSDILKKSYGSLSGGQKRRCEIAKALMNSPEILFLDEPTTGLDPATRKSVWECVKSLSDVYKMTVFLTTHYMEEASESDHIAVIDEGKILEYATPYILKSKYAADTLKIYTSYSEEVRNILNDNGLNFSENQKSIKVKMTNTLDAVPVINLIKNKINGFEVLNGTLDDVFLNITGRNEAED